MSRAIRSAAVEACDCERSGPFFTGVPGILAMMNEDGRLADGAVVERCDVCERFASDADALRRLVELGLAGDSDFSSAKTFRVRCSIRVQVEFPGVVAANSRDAARQTLDRFDWSTHSGRAEFVDDITAVLVDSEHESECAPPVKYDAQLNEVSTQSCPNCAWVFDNASETPADAGNLGGSSCHP